MQCTAVYIDPFGEMPYRSTSDGYGVVPADALIDLSEIDQGPIGDSPD